MNESGFDELDVMTSAPTSLPQGTSMTTLGGIPATPSSPTPIEYRLDFRELIDTIKNNLNGKIWDIENKKWIEVGKPLMNDKGVGLVMTIIVNFLNANTVLSYYKDWEIDRKVKVFGETLLDTLFLKAKEIGLDTKNLPMVVIMVTHQVESALKRAREGTEAKQISTAYSVVEHIENQGKTLSLPFPRK